MAGPLDGVRVLDFTVFQQGPQATLVMADMGADVIKAEALVYGDFGRLLQVHNGVGAYHLAHNRGKRSITLNLKSPEGVEIARKIAAGMDVFVHNFRPGVMERLGLAYDDIRPLNERIIYAHASGWGPKGFKAEHPAFDIAAQARSGLMSMTGEEEGGPLPVGVAIADYIGAMNLALAVIAALYSREKTGRGQKIDTSLFGSAIASQAWELQSYIMGRRKRRGGRGHAYLPTIWRTFQTSDGWAVVGGVGDDRWPAFCQAVAMPELEHDERFKDGLGRAVNLLELYKTLDDKFLAKSTKDWIEVLEAHDMICAPAQDYDALMEDPQALDNEYLQNVEHPIAGTLQVVGQPWKFSETPATIAAAAPELGQHTEEILLNLGYTWDDITALREKKAI